MRTFTLESTHFILTSVPRRRKSAKFSTDLHETYYSADKYDVFEGKEH